MLRNIQILLCVLLVPLITNAGELVRGATVEQVASNGSNDESFAIQVEGGTGVCAGNPTQWIYFPEGKVTSFATYNHSFSIALTALTNNKTVRVHNYVGSECNQADFISINAN